MKFVNELRVIFEQGLVDFKDICIDVVDYMYQIYIESKKIVFNEFSLLMLVFFIVMVLAILRV